MNESNDDIRRIAAFLSGEMKEQERLEFDKWLKISEANRNLFAEMSAVWKNSGARLPSVPVSSDEAWAEFIYARDSKLQSAGIRYLFNSRFVRVAASVILIASVTWLLMRNSRGTQEFRAGEYVLMAFLPDSSRIWLEPGSSLSWDGDFGASIRAVKLSGRGFFEVRKDSLHPFTVSAGDATVRVLGTSFDVNQSEGESVISVAEGRVAVYSASIDSVVLTEMEQVTAGKTIGRKKTLNDDSFGNWRRDLNPGYDSEVASPKSFIQTTSSWRKNSINMSVVEGTVTNTASLATYEKIVLTVTYKKGNGGRGVMRIKLDEPLAPGKSAPFHGRLLDILTDTQLISVTVEAVAK